MLALTRSVSIHPLPRRRHLESIRNPQDFWAGLLFIGLGIAAITVSANYHLGTAARMGPGYFPRILGMLLIGLGLVITLRGIRIRGEAIARWKWRPTLVVLGSVIVFGMIVAKIGVAISTVVLIVAASAASHEFRPGEAVLTALVLSALAVGVFVIGLNLQLPIWPVYFAG